MSGTNDAQTVGRGFVQLICRAATMGLHGVGRVRPPERLRDVRNHERSVPDRPVGRRASILVKNRVNELRAEQGWSQGELAKWVEVSRQSIIAIEKGKYDPSLPLAFRIAAVFSLDIEDIFTPG